MKSHTVGTLKKVSLKLQLTKAGPMEDGAAFQKPEYSKLTSFRDVTFGIYTQYKTGHVKSTPQVVEVEFQAVL